MIEIVISAKPVHRVTTEKKKKKKNTRGVKTASKIYDQSTERL